MANIPTGVYRHFKGRYYLVLGEARHTETGETLVIYQALYGEQGWWLRPQAMFLEEVERNGFRGPRFVFVGAIQPENEQGGEGAV